MINKANPEERKNIDDSSHSEIARQMYGLIILKTQVHKKSKNKSQYRNRMFSSQHYSFDVCHCDKSTLRYVQKTQSEMRTKK